MEASVNGLNLILFGPLLIAGIGLPGFWLSRLVPSPLPLLSAFLGSAALLLLEVFLLTILGLPLAPGTLIPLVLVVNVALGLAARRRPAAQPDVPFTPDSESSSRLWILVAGLGLAAVAIRIGFEPQSGFDNSFRWEFLARQMWDRGSLDFYPPVSTADFQSYGWSDGIPPLVASLNFWSYLSIGGVVPLATGVWVLTVGALLFQSVGRLAGYCGGGTAVWPARAVLATSALLLWSAAQGQETALTALSLVGMFVFLEAHRHQPTRATLIWAGVAAGIGGLSREYGLAWTLLGLASLAWSGRFRSGAATFLATALAVAAPWYLRNWIRTGNPLFPQELGGLFPGNAIHTRLMTSMGETLGLTHNPDLLPHLAAVLVVLLGPLLVLGRLGLRRLDRPIRMPLLAAALLVVVLWIWSIGQTAGGWDYSTRVLAPVAALLAVPAGIGIAQNPSWRRTMAALVLLAAGDAAFRSLYLPTNPLIAPWNYSPVAWRDFGQLVAREQDSAIWTILADEAAGDGILVDHPATFATLYRQGAQPVPLTSPAVAAAFAVDRSLPEIVAELRTAHIRFIVLGEQDQVVGRFLADYPFFRELRARAPVFQTPAMVLYDLALIDPA